MKFKVGDRVRWYNNPFITGTIVNIGQQCFGIKWDHRGEDGPIAYNFNDNEHFILTSTDPQSDFLERIKDRMS